MRRKLEDVRGVPALSSSYSVCEIHATSTRSSTQHGTEGTTSNDLVATRDSDEGRAEEDERDQGDELRVVVRSLQYHHSHQSGHSQPVNPQSLLRFAKRVAADDLFVNHLAACLLTHLPPSFPPSFDTSLCPPSPSPFSRLLSVKTAAAAAAHLCSAFRIPPSDRPVSRFRSWPTSDPQCHTTPQSIQTALSCPLRPPNPLSLSVIFHGLTVPCPGHPTRSIRPLLFPLSAVEHTCTPNRHSKLVPAALIEIHQFSH